MNTRHEPSEELKNAFVDQELAGAERRTLQARALADEELRKELCDLASIKGLVREAYDGIGETPRSGTPARRWTVLQAAAFALAFAGLGWIAKATIDTAPAPAQSLAVAQPQAGPRIASAVAMPAAPHSERVLLHIGTGGPDEQRATLDAAESLLAAAARDGQEVAVEIVANGGGLDLLRGGLPANAARIEALQARYPALTLIACRQTMERARERGEQVVLLPGVRVTATALDRIVSRLHDGWVYVRI